MNKIVILGIFCLSLCSNTCLAEATVRLTNKDMRAYIFHRHTKSLLTNDSIFIQVLGGPAGTLLKSIIPIGATNSIIKLSDPGCFDAGVGIVPDIGDGHPADFKILVWHGPAKTYDT